MTTRSILLLFSGFLLLAGCNSQDPVSLERKWANKLATYQGQIDEVRVETEGVKDFSDIFGPGSREVEGDGTFVGDGVGTATLTGVGIVTGEVDGIVQVQGTQDLDMSGFEFIGTDNGYDRYSGNGFFTATSDVGQRIEVIVEGDCWVIGAGTGMVFYSGEGWAFWY